MNWLIICITFIFLASCLGAVLFHKVFFSASPFWPGMLLRLLFTILHLFFLLEMLQYHFSMPSTPLAPTSHLPRISFFLALGILLLYGYYLFWMKKSPQAKEEVYAKTLWWGALMIFPGVLYALLTWLRHPALIATGFITLRTSALIGLVSGGLETGLFLVSLIPYLKQHFTRLALRQLIDRLYQPVVVTDKRGQILLANPSFGRLAHQLQPDVSHIHWPSFINELTIHYTDMYDLHSQPLVALGKQREIHVIQDLSSFNTRSRQLEHLSEELSNSNRLLKNLINQRLEAAKNNERQLMVQQVHDRLGQCIGYVAAAADTTLQDVTDDPEKCRRRMEKAMEMLLTFDSETLSTTPQDFCCELATLTAIYEEIGITIDLSPMPKHLPPNLCHALVEICREAFINAVCHGAAQHLVLTCAWDNELLHFTIQDDGHSSMPLEEGMGISGMRRRIHQLQGHFELIQLPHGITVDIKLPLPPESTLSSAVSLAAAGIND